MKTYKIYLRKSVLFLGLIFFTTASALAVECSDSAELVQGQYAADTKIFSEQSIATSGPVSVGNGARVSLIAPVVTLTPGFQLQTSGELIAKSSPINCSPAYFELTDNADTALISIDYLGIN